MNLADYLIDTDLRPYYGLVSEEGKEHAANSEYPETPEPSEPPEPPDGDDDVKES